MYKASIRALLRHSINKLNSGDYSLMLKMASPDFELAFPLLPDVLDIASVRGLRDDVRHRVEAAQYRLLPSFDFLLRIDPGPSAWLEFGH